MSGYSAVLPLKSYREYMYRCYRVIYVKLLSPNANNTQKSLLLYSKFSPTQCDTWTEYGAINEGWSVDRV